MTLGELKKSLSRMPPDMDDTSVVFQVTDDQDKPIFNLLAGVGYIQEPICVVLFDEVTATRVIALQEARRLKETGPDEAA